MIRRVLDMVLSFAGIIMLLPVFMMIAFAIIIWSGFPVFYLQKRVGRNNIEFSLVKFRTMKRGSDQKGLITVGAKDTRITGEGIFLRKYKLDELPQLFNILLGNMSFVGPRPEVRRYVDLYNSDQQRVLSVRPGLTDLASIEYIQENEMLQRYDDPERAYIEIIMPAKLELNLKYLDERNILKDSRIMWTTIVKLLKSAASF